MELRQLRYFVAVAEDGNISRAAQRIFLTQPALSRQIKALEEELGQPLLERGAHSIRLTPAGERLLAEARELLRHADEMGERIRSSARGVRLRVGYAPSLVSGILAAAVADFAQTHHGARVELHDLSSVEMLGGLEDNKLDIALLAASGTKSRGLTWHHLLNAEWRLAVSLRHPLVRRRRITPADAGREPLLVFNRRDYPGYWNRISTWLRRHRVTPNVAGEHDGAESLLAAVESGLGVALVTTRSVRHFAGRVHFKTLTQEPDAVSIAAVCRKERSGEKPLAVFIESLRQAAKTSA